MDIAEFDTNTDTTIPFITVESGFRLRICMGSLVIEILLNKIKALT